MTVAVASLRAEYRSDTSWVAVDAPRLSWTTATDIAAWTQQDAEVEVTRSSGTEVARVEGQVLVGWPFAPLAPREEVGVRVRVRGADGSESGWSDALTIRAGFLAEGEWRAEPIGSASAPPKHPVLLRTTFAVREGLVRATLYSTSQGVHQVFVNDRPVDDHLLKPGWTSYPWRSIFDTVDVTTEVAEGDNSILVDLAGGWFTEDVGFFAHGGRSYGVRPTVSAQLLLEYADGSDDLVRTDGEWLCTHDGPRTASGIYAGESYDARRLDSLRDGGDAGWQPVEVASAVPAPEPRSGPPVRGIEERPVAEVITSPSGRLVLDFGQNLVGRLRIRVRGEAGDVVTLRHAEVLEDGELSTRPLRAAAATDAYTLAGGGEEVWEPAFTFHGFRYAEITGWPGDFDPGDVTAVVIHSDMERIGWFESSDARLNRFHENVVWSMRGNFLSLPTDCPQRDERLGWTGDIQVFAPTASFLYDVDGFLSGWLADLRAEQRAAGGAVPFTVPTVMGPGAMAGWGDAATVVPDALHHAYGDEGVLSSSLASMKAWCEHIHAITGDALLWEESFQFGDWLDPEAPADAPGKGRTDPDVVATAYFFRSVDLTARACALLGDPDAERYAELADRVRAAFLDRYTTPAGRILSDSATAYAIAISFGLVRDTDQRAAFGDRLAFVVRRSGYRISTGFLGTPVILQALTDTGYAWAAARLMLQEECPSWLYPVTMGATTVWERWDSMLPDGSVNPGEMTSFNHYALGAAADWMHRDLAGISASEPGYRRIRIAPLPVAELDHARAVHRTPYGDAESGWRRDHGRIVVTAVLPPNTKGEVSLPDGRSFEIDSGRHEWVCTEPAGPERAPLGLMSSLADIIDDRKVYEAVVGAVESVDASAATRFRTDTPWTPKRRLVEVLPWGDQAVSEAVASALAAIEERA